MKSIVICGKGCYKLSPAHIKYLQEHGYPDANEYSFINDRTNPDLIACIDAVRTVPCDVERTVKELTSAIEDIRNQHLHVLVDYDECESRLGYYLRSLSRSFDRGSNKKPNENDVRRHRILIGNIRKRNEWLVCRASLHENLNFVYDDDIEDAIKYLYEEIRTIIPANCDIRHTWDTNAVMQIIEKYIFDNLPAWEDFIKLFYEFFQYDATDVDFDKAKQSYEKYLLFMDTNGDIIKQYLAAEDALEKYIKENALAISSRDAYILFAFNYQRV